MSLETKSPKLKTFFFFMRCFIQPSKNMCIYSLDYALFCGMKKHILELAPFLNRCSWPGWITYSSIRFNRIGREFLPNSILTKTEIFHHFSSLWHTGSAVQFIPVSVFRLWLFRGYIKPFAFRFTLYRTRKSVSNFLYYLSMILSRKKDCQGNIRGFNVCLSLISHIKCVHFAGAKMFHYNCDCL